MVICSLWFPKGGIRSEVFGVICKAVGKAYPTAYVVGGHPAVPSMHLVDPEAQEAVLPISLFGPDEVPAWIAQWVCRGEVGLSSLSLARFIHDRTPPIPAPQDQSDLTRCLALLCRCPAEERPRVAKLVRQVCADFEQWRQWEPDLLRALDAEVVS